MPVAAVQCSVELKEVRMRPVTEEHDYKVKLKSAAGFLLKVLHT